MALWTLSYGAKTASLLIWPNVDTEQQRKVVFYVLEVTIPNLVSSHLAFKKYLFGGKNIEIVLTDYTWATDFLCCIFSKTHVVRVNTKEKDVPP